MVRLLAGLFAIAFVSVGFAEDKKADAPKLSGKWVKKTGDITLTYDFVKEGELNVIVTMDDTALTMKCTYTVEKGVVKAKLKSKELKGAFPFEPDDKFTFEFKIKVDGKKAKISDYDASEGADQGKGIVEGDYEQKTE